MLFDTRAHGLFAYNDSARQLWELIEAGKAGADLAASFAEHWGIPRSLAEEHVQASLAQWRAQGLIGDGEHDPSVGPPSPRIVVDDGSLGRQSTPAFTTICTIRGRVFALAVERGLPSSIRALFAHLETPEAAPQTRLEIKNLGAGEIALLQDGAQLIRTDDIGQLIGALYQTVLELVHPSLGWLALIHGAAMAKNGAGLALPGPSGSGKSTLAAGLLAAGFDYLADDLIALSAPAGAIVPWPMPLSIKPGSVDVVAARHPELKQAASYRTKGLDARLLVPAADAWEQEPVPLRSFVFPRYAAGSPPELTTLTTFEVIERLLSDRIWLGYPITEQRVSAFLAWLNDKPAYALSFGALDDAVRLIEELP